MKIAITGKGGVGKTTLAAVLARLYAAEGRTVLAVDVDPDANLGLALGFSEEELADITPISKMKDLIAERTGADSSGLGKFFKINPRVDDIPDRFAREKNGVKLLIMGTVETGGSGCVCPEHVMVKRVISNLVLGRDEVVIMDMEAGLEHLGRGTAGMVDEFIVVIEPGARSIQTCHKVKELAADLGVKKVNVVANKVRSPEDEAFLRERIPAEDFFGAISYSDDVASADRRGLSPFDTSAAAKDEIRRIKEKIDSSIKSNSQQPEGMNP
ncbi:MAG: AAA family ATPase [Treponema sp.]|jgi:CO dehydrogenase maturation factor|nr:AAA family ATPase [Treponema sp.]